MGIHAQFALKNRHAIAAEIERLIELLDLADGDCDLEPEDDYCSAGDDGGGIRMTASGPMWGSYEEHGGLAFPIYDIDQTGGPTNLKAEERKHYLALWARP